MSARVGGSCCDWGVTCALTKAATAAHYGRNLLADHGHKSGVRTECSSSPGPRRGRFTSFFCSSDRDGFLHLRRVLFGWLRMHQ